MLELERLPLRRMDVGEPHESVHLAYRHVASGKPPLLLVHGHPQTHLMWHRVWDHLTEHHDLVAVDLRGYGDSDKPPSVASHVNYSKRVMAQDLIRLMARLGYPSFSIMAHDRGARVACRMALDHSTALRAMVLLDIAPTLDMYAGTTEAFAKSYWHWFLLIQPSPLPESLLQHRGSQYVRGVMGSRHAGLGVFHPDALRAYEKAADDPETIRAICEDYRASATIDLEHDLVSRQRGDQITVPTLVLWGRHGVVRRCFDVPALWRPWMICAQFEELDCGHYLAEEAPDALLAITQPFLFDLSRRNNQ